MPVTRAQARRSVQPQSLSPVGKTFIKEAAPSDVRSRDSRSEGISAPHGQVQSFRGSASPLASIPGSPGTKHTPSEEADRKSDFMDYPLEEVASLRQPSSLTRQSSYESWVAWAIPTIPEDFIVKEWYHLADGTHGSVRRARVQCMDFDEFVCIKLFSEEWKEAYERELEAYSLLQHRGVRRCIPQVYWSGAMPISRWDGDRESGFVSDWTSDEDPTVYGLVMEYLEDAQEFNFSKMNLDSGEVFARALIKLHEARVRHGDLEERNILLVREAGTVRVVFIDFSCAWINAFPNALDFEWDCFMAILEQNLGPEVVTEDVYAAFEKMHDERFRDDRMKAERSYPADNGVTLILRQQDWKPIYFLSASFLFIHALMLFFIRDLRDYVGYHFDSLLSSFTLSVLLFMLRNKELAAVVRRRLQYVFVGHCTVAVALYVKEYALYNHSATIGVGSFVWNPLNIIIAVFNLIWAVNEILALLHNDQ